MVISIRQKFLAENCSEINIQLDGHPVCRVEHTTSAGLIIDVRVHMNVVPRSTMNTNGGTEN